uniref:Importin N-terminal domain-containing protein n=1 Tax=Glossina pallidipes TaxID=7398 RepID=A0A1B0AGE0_GLOPL
MYVITVKMLYRNVKCYFIGPIQVMLNYWPPPQGLNLEQSIDIRSYVLNYLPTRLNLQHFVVQALVTLLAKITKYGWFDAYKNELIFENLLEDVKTFLQGSVEYCTVGVQILSQLVLDMNSIVELDANLTFSKKGKIASSFRDQRLYDVFLLSCSLLVTARDNSKTLNFMDESQQAYVKYNFEKSYFNFSLQFVTFEQLFQLIHLAAVVRHQLNTSKPNCSCKHTVQIHNDDSDDCDKSETQKDASVELISGDALEKFDIADLQELRKLGREPDLDNQGFLCKSSQHLLGIGLDEKQRSPVARTQPVKVDAGNDLSISNSATLACKISQEEVDHQALLAAVEGDETLTTRTLADSFNVDNSSIALIACDTNVRVLSRVKGQNVRDELLVLTNAKEKPRKENSPAIAIPAPIRTKDKE